VLKEIFGHKLEDITGGWKIWRASRFILLITINRILKSRSMRWARHWHYAKERCLQGFGGKSEGKRLLGRPRLIRKGNIGIDIKYAGWEGMNWIGLAENRDKWHWSFEFQKMWRIFWLTKELFASQEVLWPMELVIIALYLNISYRVSHQSFCH
jgi:hypothetical protein